MDKLKHIRELLEKFYDGSSSSAEEMELNRFFSKGNVPAEFSLEKEMFEAMSSISAPVDIPENLKEGIISTIEKAEKSEIRIRRINIYSISGLAAGLLILLTVYMGFLKENPLQSAEQYAIEDPELAYEEARKALEFVSQKWNYGTAELQNLNQVSNGMKNIRPITKISSGSKEINLLGNLKKAENIKIQ